MSLNASRTATALSSGVVSIALITALAGCSDDAPARISAPAPSAGTSSSPAPSTPPAEFSLEDVYPPGKSRSGGFIGSVGTVRVGRHPGFDRVVWQFRGRGRPSYGVHYVDEPLADGSGERADIRGDAYLQVDLSRVGIPREGQPIPPDASDSSLAGTVIADASAINGGFEGYGQAWIGLHGEKRPFRVMILTNPTRVVVDIQSD